MSTKACETCQQSPLYPLKPANTALYTTKLELLELGGGIAAKNRLGPFGPALKNHHNLLLKSGTM